MVRFNNSYSIRHFTGERALNSLHFLTAASAGFLRTHLLPKDRSTLELTRTGYQEHPVPLDGFRRSAPGFSVSSKTAVTRRRLIFAFAFRFAVVLALAVIVLLVTTWAAPPHPANDTANPRSDAIYRAQHLNLF